MRDLGAMVRLVPASKACGRAQGQGSGPGERAGEVTVPALASVPATLRAPVLSMSDWPAAIVLFPPLGEGSRPRRFPPSQSH